MYKIIHKQLIAQDIKKIDISAPLIAARALPGQFVMVTPVLGEHSIPMSIVDSDERRSVVSLLVHEVGLTTRKLGDLSIGENLYQMVGPLGSGAQMDKYGLVICVATGIGAAQILPICRGFITAMGGTVVAGNRQDRSGAIFTIRLAKAPLVSEPVKAESTLKVEAHVG